MFHEIRHGDAFAAGIPDCFVQQEYPKRRNASVKLDQQPMILKVMTVPR